MAVSKGAAAAAVLAAAAAVSVGARAKAEAAMEARREVAEAAEVHLLEAQGGSRELVAAWAVMAGQVRPPRGMA